MIIIDNSSCSKTRFFFSFLKLSLDDNHGTGILDFFPFTSKVSHNHSLYLHSRSKHSREHALHIRRHLISVFFYAFFFIIYIYLYLCIYARRLIRFSRIISCVTTQSLFLISHSLGIPFHPLQIVPRCAISCQIIYLVFSPCFYILFVYIVI